MARKFGILFAVLMLVVLVGASYAFAAGNIVDAAKAGDGSADVTGYTVSNVVYTTDLTQDPGLLSKVTFSLNNTATTVRVKVDKSGDWYSCSSENGTAWTCLTPNLSFANVDTLRVVAYDSKASIAMTPGATEVTPNP